VIRIDIGAEFLEIQIRNVRESNLDRALAIAVAWGSRSSYADRSWSTTGAIPGFLRSDTDAANTRMSAIPAPLTPQLDRWIEA